VIREVTVVGYGYLDAKLDGALFEPHKVGTMRLALSMCPTRGAGI
jgi:hypothetical protein